MTQIKLNLSGHANKSLDDLGFVFPGVLHVDLLDPLLGAKVAELLSQWVGSGDQVTVALPGLSPLASIVLAVIHGLTGQFPKVQPLIRQQDGSFVAGNPLDLQGLRNDVARADHRQTLSNFKTMEKIQLTPEELESLQDAILYYDCACLRSMYQKVIHLKPGDTIEILEKE